MTIILCSIFVILGSVLLYKGLRGAIKKQPFVSDSAKSIWFMVLAFSPNIIWSLYMFWKSFSLPERYSGSAFPYISLIPVALYVVLIYYYRQILRGYSITGVTDESFRQALYSVLKDLQLPFEERLSKLHLTTLDADIEANVSGFMGTANIRVKQKEHQPTLDRIAEGLRNYFADSHVAVNMTTFVYHIIFGVFMFICAGIFGYLFTKISDF